MMVEKSSLYRKMGNRVIKGSEFDELRMSNCRIAYLTSDLEKKQNRKTVFADCRKVAEQYKWCCPYDFMITVYEPNILRFTEHQKEVLIRHELLHCGVDWDSDETSFYIVPHDIEEFYAIINDEGMGWQKEEIGCQDSMEEET